MKRNRFTLVEVLLASAISASVMVCMIATLLYPVQAFKEGTAQFAMDSQMQSARERMLRGLKGRVGLRSAMRESISPASGDTQSGFLSFSADCNPVPTPADLTDDEFFVVQTSESDRRLKAWFSGDAGTDSILLTRGVVAVEEMTMTRMDDQVVVTVRMSAPGGRRRMYRRGTMTVSTPNCETPPR